MSVDCLNSLPFSQNKPWLAPLAGYSDLPFRLLCREFGAAVAVTEMVSAKGLVYGGKSTDELLATCPQDQPLVVQLFGSDPEFLARGVDICRERGFSWFDLNAGCPVKKVTKTGSGAALLVDPERLVDAVSAVCERAGPGRAGVKTRLGWDRNERVMPGLGPRLEQAGAAWITLHPRFGKQGFSGEASWGHLKELADVVSVPVIASGDLFTAEDGVRCVRETGVATVMFARGALADPRIFTRYTLLLSGETLMEGAPNPHDLSEVIRRHVALMREHGNEHRALLATRTIIPRYVRSMPGVRALRNRLTYCKSWRDLDKELDAFLFSGLESNGNFPIVNTTDLPAEDI
ncbi:MAG: tRNA-dihydrouridine synthase family protein [Desulfovibrio sp.]|nr:MAG: tRNA-dihydrouridine synthase family protein [Desulfovibrio sp.]